MRYKRRSRIQQVRTMGQRHWTVSLTLHHDLYLVPDWMHVPALTTVQRIVARVSSRVLVGQELGPALFPPSTSVLIVL